jgi:hypothetical protein
MLQCYNREDHNMGDDYYDGDGGLFSVLFLMTGVRCALPNTSHPLRFIMFTV